jgi:VWFA-related protein
VSPLRAAGQSYSPVLASGTRMRSRLTALLIIIAVVSAANAQQPRYSERVEVTRLMLDARVLDDDGRPVRGLAVEDFAVKIGGKVATIESVLWVGGAREETLLDSSGVVVPAPPEHGRLVVFLFQKSLERSRIVGFMRMLIEARGLLNTLSLQDRVAVLSFDSRLHVWLDFTNNFDRVRRVFERGILFERAAAVQESADPSLVRRLNPTQASRTYSIERALRRIGEALADLPGAKSVVLVGHGFGRLGLGGAVYMENEYDEMREALQAARASVFSLDVTEADYHSLEAGLQVVAADTGGFFARTHILHKRALDLLAGALAGHYVLFVELPALERGVHAAEVKLRQGKWDVLAKRSWVVSATDTTRTAPAPPVQTTQASCAATASAGAPFVPPGPYPRQAPGDGTVWHGTDALWTMVPAGGTWRSLPRGEHGYRQKVFLWRPGYDGRADQWPAVTVIGRRLDADAPPLVAEAATNAYRRDFGGWAMLVGVEVPTAGCWQLTATHGGASLTFVVRVDP